MEVYQLDIVLAFLAGLDAFTRRRVSAWASAMVIGPPPALAPIVFRAEGVDSEIRAAVVPDTNVVVAFLWESAGAAVTILGVVEALDGLVVHAAHRMLNDGTV